MVYRCTTTEMEGVKMSDHLFFVLFVLFICRMNNFSAIQRLSPLLVTEL
jgi:hypothetical protein